MDEKEIDKRIQDTWGNTDREILAELLKENQNFEDKACEIFYDKEFYGNPLHNLRPGQEGVR